MYNHQEPTKFLNNSKESRFFICPKICIMHVIEVLISKIPKLKISKQFANFSAEFTTLIWAVGKLFVDDGVSLSSENVTFSFFAERSNYGDSTTELHISCAKSFDGNFDTSIFRNLNLAKITILNSHSIPENVIADGVRQKQKLRVRKGETVHAQINLLKNNCREDIVIKWNSVHK